MSPSRHSPWLACSILEQTSRHARLRKPATKLQRRSTRDQHDLLVAQLEVHLIPGLQTSAVPQCLRDHHLSLSTDSTSHTLAV
jgi:hypothetical protein